MCKTKVLATVHGEVLEPPVDEFGRNEPYHVTLVACDTCGTAMVLQAVFIEGPDIWAEPENVWPNGVPWVAGLPYEVERAFREAYRCFHQAQAYSATATMARRALELICKEQGATGRDLAKKIESLRQAKKIEGQLFDWAQALRFAGNEGAHGEDVSRQDAEDVLALTEALMEYIYVLTAKHDAFKSRRDARRSAPKVVAQSVQPCDDSSGT